MKVKFKKLHPDAIIPKIALNGDVGLDLTVTEVNETDLFYELKFGLAVEIPIGFFGIIAPRSSITKMNHMMKNGIGIIDQSYRGPLVCRMKKVKFDYGADERKYYKVGDRAAQLIILPYPTIEPVETDELVESERGINGFGSTGK